MQTIEVDISTNRPSIIDVGIANPEEAFRLSKQYTDKEIAKIRTFRQEVVSELPEIGDQMTLYFVPASKEQPSNIHDEYIWVVPKDGQTFSPHWEQVGSTAIDHEVVDDSGISKLILTIGDKKYAIAREEIVKPATPTLTAGGVFTRSKAVTIACATSGVTIRYTINGEDPTATTGIVGTSITLNQDTSVQTKTYIVKAIAVKNGQVSNMATATYNINRQVDTPTFASATGNKYSSSRTITFACATAGATILYKIGNGDWQTGSSVTINATSAITLRAIKEDWADSANTNATTYTVGAGKCYIGQAASVTNESDIKALASAYEQDTLVGSTKAIDFGDNTQYVWFAIPNTAAKNLTVKSGGFDVALLSAAGSVIGGYRVWRTLNTINSSWNFVFS